MYAQAYQQVEAEEYDKAITNSLEAIRNTNEAKLRAAIYDNLGTAYYLSGNKNKAIESLNHALEEDNSFIQARYNLGVYSYEMGNTNKLREPLNWLYLIPTATIRIIYLQHIVIWERCKDGKDAIRKEKKTS